MVYPPLSLAATSLAVGLLLIAVHTAALLAPAPAAAALRAFPRSRAAGIALTILAGAWAWLLIRTMDLGEFSSLRTPLLVLIPVAVLLAIRYVDEFLAVRSLGMVLLLAAEPLLEAAFLKPIPSRLALVLLAYAWIVAGMFWVGMPYLLRDQAAWACASTARLRAGAAAGIAYGAALVTLSLTLYRSA